MHGCLVADEVFAAGELLWAAGSISASLVGGLVTSGGFLHTRARVLS